MNLSTILKEAQEGKSPGCIGCPWNPRNVRDEKITFGTSCKKHGFEWDKDGIVNTFLIRQDPADSAPDQTGVLCPICNNRSQNTANYHNELSDITASLSTKESTVAFLKKQYWTNSIMHGAGKGDIRDSGFELARQKCKAILKKQIEFLQPMVIICCGKTAIDSLFELGLLSKPWSQIRRHFSKGAYIEGSGPISFWGMDNRWITCTHHGSIGSVNRNASQDFNSIDFEHALKEKIKLLPDTTAVNSFLKKYDNISNAKHRGLRVMLLHWLDIGIITRKTFKENFSSEKPAA